MSWRIILLSLGMMLVTYIPRALPAVLSQRLRFSKKTAKFLSLIPYTAMAALIFPGILTVDQSNVYIGLAGGLTAVGLSYLKAPVIVVIAGAVAADVLLYLAV